MIKVLYIKKQKNSIILYNKQQRGFSLIEMMVAVVILGLIILALVTFFTGGTKAWVAGQSQLEAQRNARQAMDRMVREIREASNVIASSTSSIEINFNTPWNTNLKYSWSGDEWDPILRGTIPLINNVQSLAFTFFDTSNVEVDLTLTEESASKISKVHIDLRVDVDQDSNPDITLNADVKLRNFGL